MSEPEQTSSLRQSEHIPPAVPARSRTHPLSTFPALTKDEINSLPIRAYEGDVMLVQTREELEQALEELGEETILGFDTETKPTFTRGKICQPALIQLAGQHKVYLVQLTHLPFDHMMAAVLSDCEVIKAGVGIRDDMRALGKLFPFDAGGEADLAVIARAKGIRAQGLRTLAANLLGFRISKGAQCSNWESQKLSAKQIKYAATDAWIGRELYLVLN